MNDIQNADMRALLSHAVPPPEDEPGVRDVVGPAMAWGERRRRLDRAAVGAGTAMAVLAVTAGVLSLGNGAGARTTTRPGTTTDEPVPGGIGIGSPYLVCGPPGPRHGSTEYCALQNQIIHYDSVIRTSVIPAIRAKLPAGLSLRDTGNGVLTLTDGTTTEYLSVNAWPHNDGVPVCTVDGCKLVETAGGTAVLDYNRPVRTVQWTSHDPSVPDIVVDLSSEPMVVPGPYQVGTSPGSVTTTTPRHIVKLMTADQIAAIVGDSGFQTTIRQKYAELDTMIRRLEQLAASDPGAIYPVTGQTCGPADVTSTYTWPSGDPSSTGDPTGGGTSSDPGTPTSTLTGGGPSSPGYSSITSYPSSTGFPSSTGGPSSTGFPSSTGYPTSGKTSSRPGIPSSTLTAGVPSSMPYIPPTSTSQPGCGGTSTTASPTHS